MNDDVTRYLSAIESDDPQAAEKLLPIIYDELRKLAAVKLSQERPGQTLQATALVHEAYLRLLGPEGDSLSWTNRGHFFAAAAEAMRRILIDNARRKVTVKHGGGHNRVDLPSELADVPDTGTDDDLIALDEALTLLEQQDSFKARLVELRYFGGLTGDQAAEALGISPKTADRHWAFARAWLRREMDAR